MTCGRQPYRIQSLLHLTRAAADEKREGGVMPIEKITCVQFDGEFPDFCYRLIMPDYGMPLIGTMLAHAGYDVRIYLEHIQPAEPARIADSDLLCLSTLNAGADKTFRFARD